MCLMQDGTTSHIAHEPFASSCLGHPNRLTLFQLSITGMASVGWLGDRDLPMKDNLHVQQFLMDGCSGITQRRVHVHVCDIDAQLLPDRHRSELQSFQVLSPMNLCCDDCVSKFYTCIDVIKRNQSDRIAINYEFITVTMRLQSIDFCDF